MSTTPPPVPPKRGNEPLNETPVRPIFNREEFHVAEPESRYSLRNVVQQLFILLVISAATAIAAYFIDIFAEDRSLTGLLPKFAYAKVSSSTSYCFALTFITLSTLMLMDLRFRRPVNNIQYVLIGCAIFCFYLLMLSFAEHLRFDLSYAISSLMTLILLSTFTNSLMHKLKATATITVILIGEYAILLGLLYIGSFALLAGSLILFALIALAMFFTQRMKIVDGEIFIG